MKRNLLLFAGIVFLFTGCGSNKKEIDVADVLLFDV